MVKFKDKEFDAILERFNEVLRSKAAINHPAVREVFILLRHVRNNDLMVEISSVCEEQIIPV
jgi:hypothetical protein